MRSLLLACAALLPISAEHADLPSAPGAAPLRADPSCKPSGPLAVELAVAGRRPDGALELSFSIRPVLSMQAVEWELELPADGRLVEGAAFGSATTERDDRTSARAVVWIPRGDGRTEVRLRVSGRFEATDELGGRRDEAVEVVRAVSWGRHDPVGRVFSQRDPRSGAVESMVALASFERSAGRAGGERGGDGAALDVDVTGVFEYVDKAWDYDGWTGADPILPIRRAKVQVVDLSGTVLATGTSGQDGSFSVPTPAPGAGSLEVRVQVVADSNSDPTFQRIRVRDGSNNVYVSPSPSTYFIDAGMNQLDVGTITVLPSVSGGDEAHPFNMFDMGIRAWEYLTGPCKRAKVATTVSIRWPGGSGSYASGSTANMATDDGYDDAVILHELGHVVHNLYSDNDEPGGAHSFGDSDQDPRLSLGEGFGTFWGGAVMHSEMGAEALYCDMQGGRQVGGIQLRLRMENVVPYRSDSFGAADEVAVAATLFDIVDDESSVDASPGSDDDPFVATTLIGDLSVHEAWFQVFEGPVKQASNLTLNHFWDGWFGEHGADGLHPELETLFRLRKIQYFNDDDEPNDRREDAVPIVGFGSWSPFRTLYAGSGPVPVPGALDEDWHTMDLVVGSRITVQTRYPNGASDADTQGDTELSLWNPAGAMAASDQGSGTGRNAKISSFLVDATGPWTFRVRTTSGMRYYGRYNYRVSYDFENFLPQVVRAPSASPRRIVSGMPSTLSALATDAQPLSYTWTPRTGGRIEGSGPTVTFVPPRHGPRRLHEIELTITDSLGASVGPMSVYVDTRLEKLRRP